MGLALWAAAYLAGCSGDPTSVDGAVSAAASAVAARDHAALFPLIDERARHALGAVHAARQAAATLIRTSYPEPVRERALTELGDAATAESPVALFALRCAEPCLAEFARTLGAPREITVEGPLTRVQTVRGTALTLYRSGDGRYGLVWETDALARERTRAAAALDLIQKNASAYAQQRALE